MGLPIRVVLADKSPLVLRGLTQLFAEDGRFQLADTATNGERFVESLDRVAFDVGVIGWMLPVRDGRSVLQSLRARLEMPRIIVYTGSPDPTIPGQAMAAGAAGFCSKTDPPERLLEVIVAVAEGLMVFPFLNVYRAFADPLAELTSREVELLAALSLARNNAEIARELGISVHTVKFHLRNLYNKLHVENRAQAVALYHSLRGS